MAYYQSKNHWQKQFGNGNPEATYNAENVTNQIIESAKVKIDIDQRDRHIRNQSDMLFRGDKGD